tara:strand:- start:4821 stop:6200 length:1380 start_codon:yes stop_codon:yes gene_type:complete
MNFGIDSIDYYIPKLSLSISELAEKRNISAEKLHKGLGLKSMALVDSDEDAASMAANALLNLINNNNINPSSIGRVYLGTESALDASKPTATYAVGTVEKKLEHKFGKRCFRNCDVLDITFACVGAVDALENCMDWVRLNPKRKAIVIASDIAKYELGSSGEYTQGAGAVAILVKNNPDLINISPTVGISTSHVGDFFKPRRILSNSSFKASNGVSIHEITNSKKEEIELFFEEPIFDGYYSNNCYQERINEGLEHFYNQKNTNYFKDWDHYIFHLPYAFHGRRMLLDIWLKWLKENKLFFQLEKEIGIETKENYKEWKKAASKSSIYKDFINKKVADGEKASSNIGNMYTASIFMSLISLLTISLQKNKNITGNKIGFLSYGSGSKSKIFEGTVVKNWKNKINKINIFKSLDERKLVDFKTYEKLHNSAIKNPILSNDAIVLTSIETKENKQGFRYYS